MEEREAVLAELQGMRERAAALLRAKLEAAAAQIREAAARTVGELEVVLPPDLDTLFPLTPVDQRLAGLEERLLALTKPAPAPPAAAVALETLRRLDAGRAQSEVLQELLRQLDPWCGQRAIVVFREGQVAGWSGAGFADGDPVRGWRGPLAESPALSKVAEGAPVSLDTSADPLVGRWLGSGRAVLAVPMSLRGKVVGGLVAVESDGRLAGETVQLLVYLCGLLLETLAVRPAATTSALLDPLVIGPAAPPAPEPAVAPISEPAFAMPEEPPAPVEEPTLPPAEPSPVADASATVHLKVPVAPVAPARPAEEERRHEEARRFARLLVSEIRLYNEQAVGEGKANRDIYQRLKEDIDRSREMYEQRVPAEVRASSNYFFEELVRILADGDSDALGL